MPALALLLAAASHTFALKDTKGLELRGSSFQDGVIEAEIAGSPRGDANATARGFVGIAFRVAADASRFDRCQRPAAYLTTGNWQPATVTVAPSRRTPASPPSC